MLHRSYPSDLSDVEFTTLAPHQPLPCSCGRPWKHLVRDLLEGIFYVVRTGCQCRALPPEYPPWQTVYWWFRRWRLDGMWDQLNTALRERVRLAIGRHPQPSAGIIDSQSVKTSALGGVRGFDGGKKINGRKRHVLVDTLGLVLKAVVHAADIQDRAAVPVLLGGIGASLPRFEQVWVDQGYTGGGKRWIEETWGGAFRSPSTHAPGSGASLACPTRPCRTGCTSRTSPSTDHADFAECCPARMR
jgi:putative transposase